LKTSTKLIPRAKRRAGLKTSEQTSDSSSAIAPQPLEAIISNTRPHAADVIKLETSSQMFVGFDADMMLVLEIVCNGL
jgi:hypothetical protein